MTIIAPALIFIVLLLPTLQEFRCSISSFYRSVERNRVVGGLEDSLHLEARAIDCVLDTMSNREEFYEALRALGFEVVYYTGSHTHIEGTDK